jgi:hypothetical protein
MSPKGEKYEKQFPLVGRVCCPLPAQSKFRRKEKSSPSTISRRFFQDFVSQGEVEAGLS